MTTTSPSMIALAVPGEGSFLSAIDVELHPVAVELDFMEPLVARRRLGFEGGELGFDESGHRR